MQLNDSAQKDKLRYLSADKRNKESIKDFIQSSRKLLLNSLITNDRRQQLDSIREKTDAKKRELSDLKAAFQEDLQRFQSIKSEMEAVSQLKNEELAETKEKADQLDLEYQDLLAKRET